MRTLSLVVVATAVAAGIADASVSHVTSFRDLVPSRRLAGDATCTILNNVDYVGNDIGSAPAASATDCCAKCGAQSGCAAFSWTDWNGGTCWFKSKRGTISATAGARSGDVGAAVSPGATCAIEVGVDYTGNDIASVAGASASDCCAKCSARADCGAFSWTASNGGTCYLKSGKGATTLSDQVSSGVVQRATCPALETNVDYAGNDVGSVAGAGASDCCTKCSQTDGCGAFTWTNWNGGTCWLKSGKGTASPSSGAVSAVLSYTSTPPPAKCSSLETNVDYAGSDLASVKSAKADDCCSKCAAFAGCWAFSWSNYEGGTCFLKSAKGEARISIGVVSAALPGAPTPQPTTPRPLTPRPTTRTPPPTGHVQWKIRSGVIPARSANLGGWLVGEYWMSKASPAWKGADFNTSMSGEYVTMKMLGKARGTAQFEQHRATWITEADIIEMANAGLNSVRVPIGFWIVNDDPAFPATSISQVYAAGSLKYLDKLINQWAVTHNLAVMISLHAHQGSQNGADHSAPQEFEKKNWYTSQANVDNSLQLATFIAARYKNSEAFLGLNLMNEPSVPTPYDVLLGYYTEAYKRIRATGNDCIIVTSPLVEQQSPDVMRDFMPKPAFYNVWHEFHPYFKWGLEGLNEQQIIEVARGYRTGVLDKWNGNPLYLGEWSLGSPEATAPFKDRTLLKQYAAVQLKNYDAATSGWSFWAWRNDQELDTATTGILSGWSMRQAIREGIFTVPRV